ncbi:MAG: aminopeptidase [Solirubrobacterales bacterium]|nr:aminopeptidase [Solirubrobacterales bacterium]
MSVELDRAVATVVERCLGVAAGEEVLVVADPERADLGRALHEAVLAAGGDGALAIVAPDAGRGTEPPRSVAAALARADAYLAPCLPSISHTLARKVATEAGVRGATLPGVTAELLARLMGADFDVLTRRSQAVAALLTEADEAHLTCPRGTNLRLDLSGRAGISDHGDLTAPGAFGNLPCGEGFVAPFDGEGPLVASSVPGPGVISDEPVLLTVAGGWLVAGEGRHAAAYLEQLDAHGHAGRNLAELGVGTNERATLTGNILEDEKILGTAHVAFGASAAIGGTVAVAVHLDVVVLEPTVTVGGTTVVDAGRFVL